MLVFVIVIVIVRVKGCQIVSMNFAKSQKVKGSQIQSGLPGDKPHNKFYGSQTDKGSSARSTKDPPKASEFRIHLVALCYLSALYQFNLGSHKKRVSSSILYYFIWF